MSQLSKFSLARLVHSFGVIGRISRRSLGPALAALAALAPAPSAQVTLHFEDMFGPCGEQDLVSGPQSWSSQGVTFVSGLATDGVLNLGAVFTPALSDTLGLWAYNGASISFDEPMSHVQLRAVASTPSQTPPTFRVTSGGVEVLSFTVPNGQTVLVEVPLLPASTEIGIQYVTGSHSLLTIDRLFAVPDGAVPSGGYHVPGDAVGHWPMESSDPALTLLDAAGSLDGSHTSGSTHVPGAVGDGLSMPGSAYAYVPDDDAIDFDNGDFSVAFWLRTTLTSGVINVLDKRVQVNGVTGYHVYLWNGRLGFQLADGVHSNWTSSAFVADSAWHHVAVTVDRDQPDGLRFYVDGLVLPDVVDPTARSGSISNSSAFFLWSSSSSAMEDMDELVLAGRVLTAAEIAGLAGTGVHLPDPWANLGAALGGSLGAPLLAGTGTLEPLSDGEMLLTNARADAPAALCLSLQSTPMAFKGGLLKTLPILSLTDVTIPGNGELSLPFTWPAGVPAGVAFYQQFMIKDLSAPNGVALSNCVMGFTP